MILLEPCDLEDLDPARALEAVAADIRAHQATPDAAGFFTATRHTSLLAALLVALHGDALHQLDQEPAADRHRAGPLTACASQVATALAHYSRAGVPLAALAASTATTLAQQLDGVEQYSTAVGEIHAARQALDHARTALTGPVPPTPRPAPAPTPAPRRTH
ncbi:hypothetical protein [Streptomyces sp. CA-111067]|uniref:hypothetical protein n=1 Tax=Streptomyces sp. CA-111067 TaxID=3240046 RepID=UPI003D987E7C